MEQINTIKRDAFGINTLLKVLLKRTKNEQSAKLLPSIISDLAQNIEQTQDHEMPGYPKNDIWAKICSIAEKKQDVAK